jgi:hypothetical protein
LSRLELEPADFPDLIEHLMARSAHPVEAIEQIRITANPCSCLANEDEVSSFPGGDPRPAAISPPVSPLIAAW